MNDQPTPAGVTTLLLASLALTVPVRREELRHHTPQQLADLAHDAARVVAQHGDDLQYGGRDCTRALHALTTGLAAAALTAWGGINFAGHHWCADPYCPGRDAEHPRPDTWRPCPAPEPRPVTTVPVGSLL